MKRVLLLDGESEAHALTDHLVDVRGLFAARGWECETLDLCGGDGGERLAIAVRERRPDFVLGLSGFGADLTLDEGWNYWEAVRVPFVGLMPDSPVHYPDRHQIASSHILFLYSDLDHLHIANRIGSPTTRRGLVAQWGHVESEPLTPWNRLDVPLLYAKGGGDPKEVRARWAGWPRPLRQLADDLVATWCWRSDVSIWDAVTSALGAGVPEPAITITRTIETYIRRARATRLLEELLSFPMHVAGGDWRHVDFTGARATLHERVRLPELRRLFRRTKLVLNSLPAVRMESHHRLIEGALHGAAVASDRNRTLDSVLGTAYLPLGWERGAIREAVATAFATIGYLEAIADHAREISVRHYDADRRFDELLATISEFLGSFSHQGAAA